MAWPEIPGLTEQRGRPTLPLQPDVVAMVLTEALELRDTTKVVARMRARTRVDLDRIRGLLAWLPRSKVVRIDGVVIDPFPGTNLVDLAIRFAAWASAMPVRAQHAEARRRYVEATIAEAQATADARGLRGDPTTAKACRAWLASQAVAPVQATATDAALVPEPIRAKVAALVRALETSFAERRRHIRAALLAMLSGEHTLLLGPPGTAKSMLARALCACLRDGVHFEYLLTRFTAPDELFGPVSIPGLKDEDYRRLTTGFLPAAHVAFLDEIFKANSAILNSLLTLVNERVFHHGRHRDRVPLVAIIGASNELPEAGDGLDALYDRFLIRLSVPPLADPDAFIALVADEIPGVDIPDAIRLTLADLAVLQGAADRVTIPPEVRKALIGLWDRASGGDWAVSDRRWRRAVRMLRLAAATDGRTELAPVDLVLLDAVLVPHPDRLAEVRGALLEQIGPDAVPEHDLRAQWALVPAEKVAPTVADPRPEPLRAESRWTARLAQRRKTVERFLAHHAVAVQQLAADRARLEAIGERHLWLAELPLELLSPHIEATRDLAAILGIAERHRRQLTDEVELLHAILAYLPQESTPQPKALSFVLGIGDVAVGYHYKQWKRLGRWQGDLVTVEPDAFLDWLAGGRASSVLMAGAGHWDARSIGPWLEELRAGLQRHLLPTPPALPDP